LVSSRFKVEAPLKETAEISALTKKSEDRKEEFHSFSGFLGELRRSKDHSRPLCPPVIELDTSLSAIKIINNKKNTNNHREKCCGFQDHEGMEQHVQVLLINLKNLRHTKKHVFITFGG
jgi:hypothetical protein